MTMNIKLKFKIINEYGSVASYCRKMGFSTQYLYRELKVGRPLFIKRIADSLAIDPSEYKLYF